MRAPVALCVGNILALGVAETSHAIVAGQIDTFQNGTTLNWVEALQGAIPPALPTVVANAGPDGVGDFALRLTATGAALGPGGRLVVNNVQPRWVGNYVGAGANGIILDVRNLNAFPLTLRVGIGGPAIGTTGGRCVTQGVVVPASSGWMTLTFALLAQLLVAGDPTATSAATTVGSVAVLRIMNAPAADWKSTPVAGQMDLDNIEALPEPSLGLSLHAGGLLARSPGSCRPR